MELREMQYFLCLAEEGNVTRAARRLNIVQPALSMQIAKLEAGFGKSCFHRARRVSLTPAGETLVRLVMPIVRDAERAEEEMAQLDGKSFRPGQGRGLSHLLRRAHSHRPLQRLLRNIRMSNYRLAKAILKR